MKKTMLVVSILIVSVLILTGCNLPKVSVDWSASTANATPTPASISGYGQEVVDYSSITGVLVNVRTDLKPNPNGFYQRDIIHVYKPADLGIDFVPPFKYDSVERDFDVAKNEWQPYTTIVVGTADADSSAILQYAADNKDVKVTSVVIRIDKQKKQQECSLEGIQSGAVRYNVYKGEQITYQLCDPSWTTQ